MTDGIADLAFDRTDEGFLALDRDGAVREANPAARSILGLDGAPDGTGVSGIPDEIRDLLEGVPDDGVTTGELEVSVDGEQRFVDVEVTPVDEEGDVELLVRLRDASDRVERHRYRGILEASGDAVYALDPEGRYTYTNRANTELLGYDESEMIGMPVSEIMEAEDIERIEEEIRALLAGGGPGRTVVEHDVIARDGERIPVANHVSILTDDGGVFRGTAGIVRDVSERKEREEKLERYERIVEAMGDGVYAMDADGRYTLVNEHLLDLNGYDREEVIGADPELIHDEEEIERFQEAIQDLLKQNDSGVKTVEAELATADGAAIPIEVNLTVLQGPEGEFHGTVGVVRDITERKERERELERYETLLNLMPDTVVVTDTEGRHQEIHGFEGWSGYTEEELIGEHISMTAPEEDVERANEAARELFLNDDVEKVTYEQIVITKGGEQIPMENHLTLLPPDEDGMIPGSMSVLRNISERKEREEQLRRQNERLEEFASVVSHDLRNPLNVAHARVRMAQQKDDPELLEKADAALVRMNELIEDLLALAREGQAVGETAPVSLGAVARDAWESVEAPDASLSVDVDATIEADRARLAELFGNLFRNSVEHGSTGSRASPDDAVEHAGPAVRIRVGAIEESSAGEESSSGDGSPPGGFYVEDDGPGIPPEEREEVLERGVTGSEDGTGYGLAIVEDIAEAHGWSVRVTGGTDGGARFEFSLPDPTGDDESPAG